VGNIITVKKTNNLFGLQLFSVILVIIFNSSKKVAKKKTKAKETNVIFCAKIRQQFIKKL
jgi:hypothetical protein